MKENYNNFDFDPIEFIKIIENLYDVVEIWDDNYKLIYVNAAVYNSLGVRPKQLIGKTYQELQSEASYWTPSMLSYIYTNKKTVIQTQETILGVRYKSIGVPILNTIGKIKYIVITSRKNDADLLKSLDPVISKETQNAASPDIKNDCNILYHSDVMGRTIEIAKKIAQTDAPCLILGETGTGKNLLAKYIHQNSSRKDNVFLTINMASMNPNLIESELFGYDKGSFTGANKEGKPGLFKIANGGTLFLDEIGELPAPLQAKFLHVLQENEFTPIGGTTPIKTDIRIISATNQDLEVQIKEGTFRKDLFYRLNIFELTLPPLRERDDDINFLISYYLNVFNHKYKKSCNISQGALNSLCSYEWPGNIRELSNIIERSVVIAENDFIQERDLPEYLHTYGDSQFAGNILECGDFNKILEAYKAEVVQYYYSKAQSSRKLAKVLNISPSTAGRLIQKYIDS